MAGTSYADTGPVLSPEGRHGEDDPGRIGILADRGLGRAASAYAMIGTVRPAAHPQRSAGEWRKARAGSGPGLIDSKTGALFGPGGL